MKRQRALELLRRSKSELQVRFGVTQLALFGSTARDTATTGSDVDVLVSFDGPATSKRYFGVQFFLEDLFDCPVDLVTDGDRVFRVKNGHPLMGYVTGTGCTATATIGAFLAVDADPLSATATALAFFGLAGEV
ncbi:MAG: hydroxyethylthiazole kinase, partial [Gammaproteobacteria bacterium]